MESSRQRCWEESGQNDAMLVRLVPGEHVPVVVIPGFNVQETDDEKYGLSQINTEGAGERYGTGRSLETALPLRSPSVSFFSQAYRYRSPPVHRLLFPGDPPSSHDARFSMNCDPLRPIPIWIKMLVGLASQLL
ncbi:hypothetical protein NM208_g13404 [Fusarium decemcellulare]|uniref:Uncharacterized protein n=1 Tax=Fusarium decemcellulare TaxID=57161 RepID=A0ACC1RK13_9HYPO|nr:hypothetical protein NM208_g13404 [Fusarium decemcellulare]